MSHATDTPVPNLVLLVTGRTLPSIALREGSFEAMFRKGLDESGAPYRLQAVDITELGPSDPLLQFEGVDGIIMTGSAAMIAEQLPWMRYGEALIREIVDKGVPFLGVCFGHQLLGRAFGSDVGPNPKGYGVGTVPFTPTGVIPFDGAPTETIPVSISHMDVVRTPGPRVEVLGAAPHDGCHMIQVGPQAFGVQFHPEFNHRTVEGYIRGRVDRIESNFGPGAHLERLKALEDTPKARGLLGGFLSFCTSMKHT